MRRTLPPEPLAVSADWSRRSALLALVGGMAAVLVSRGGAPTIGLALLDAAVLCALLALGLAMRAAVVIWRTGRRGSGRALAGTVLALALLAYPAVLAVKAWQLPAIADVSTDLVAPPGFATSPAARAARGGWVHEEPSAAVRDAQRRAYPGLAPTLLDLGADEAYKLVLKTVTARRWRVVDAAPPKGRFGTGHVDAVAGSTVMGLPEDITLRLRSQGGQIRVDMRSASRIERHDTGSNAARVESLMADLANAE